MGLNDTPSHGLRQKRQQMGDSGTGCSGEIREDGNENEEYQEVNVIENDTFDDEQKDEESPLYPSFIRANNMLNSNGSILQPGSFVSNSSPDK